MIFKINFDIIKPSQQAYVNISKHADDIKEGFVTAVTKEHLNVITTILTEEKVSFTVEEIDAEKTNK